MTKYEFLGDLSRLLADLPEEERKQALHYYEDYFVDAGEDHEQDVLKELGSPEDIADQIKNDGTGDISYGDSARSHAADAPQLYQTSRHTQDDPSTQYTSGSQNGWHKMPGSQNSSSPENGGWNPASGQNTSNNWQQNSGSDSQTGWNQTSDNYSNTNGSQTSYQQADQKRSGFFAKMDQSNTLIMIIVLIVTSPIWGSVLISIAGILLGIVSAIVGIFAAMIFGGAGSAIGGVATIIGGIIGIIAGKTAGGILTIGVGCLLFALGSAFCYLGIFLAIRLFPLLWKQLQRFWDWITGKLTGKEQSY